MVLESEFPPDIRVENEIETLIKAGHTVDIACTSFKDSSSEQHPNGYYIYRKKMSKFTYKSSIGLLNYPFYFRFWKKFIATCLISKKYDTLHIHDLPLAKIGCYFKEKYKLKFTLDLHENWPVLLDISSHTKTFLGRFFFSKTDWIEYERKYTKLADNIVVVIDEAKTRLVQMGIDPVKIFTVKNTLKTDLFNFSLTPRNNDKIIFVYGGGVNYHRGLQDVIQAMSELPNTNSNFELWIIGSGSYLDILKKLAKELQISNKIIFYGWKKQNELLRLISQANVALIPHIKSGHTDNTIPHKIFQYMYAGLPIIASNCDPLKRIIEETKSGYIYESGNKNSLLDVLESILDNPLSLDEYSNSKNWVIEKYNWEKDSNTLLSLYT